MSKPPRRPKPLASSADTLSPGPFRVSGGLQSAAVTSGLNGEGEKIGSTQNGTIVERHDDGLPFVRCREYDELVTSNASGDVQTIPDILHEDVGGDGLTTVKTEPATASVCPQIFSRAEGLIELLQKERSDLLAALRNTYELAMSLQQEVAVKAGGTMSEQAAATLMHARWKILQAEGRMR